MTISIDDCYNIPPKTNMEPENDVFFNRNLPLPGVPISGSMFVLRGIEVICHPIFGA